MADRKSIDEQFSDSYRTDPRTLQPSVGGVKQVRSVQTEKNYDPNKRRGGSSTTSADQNLENQTRRVDVQNQTDGVRSVAVEQSQSINQGRTRARQTFQKAGRSLVKRKKLTAKGAAKRVIGTRVTMMIWSWAFWVWLWFQLPFAILSIAFMAMTEVLHQMFEDYSILAEDRSLWESAYTTAVGIVLSLVTVVSDAFQALTGFSFQSLHPANFFMLTHVLVMFIGWGTMLAIGIIYTMSAQKAFSGTGASGKNGMFLLALIGYSIPILNLFPWFFLWTLMVLKNPK